MLSSSPLRFACVQVDLSEGSKCRGRTVLCTCEAHCIFDIYFPARTSLNGNISWNCRVFVECRCRFEVDSSNWMLTRDGDLSTRLLFGENQNLLHSSSQQTVPHPTILRLSDLPKERSFCSSTHLLLNSVVFVLDPKICHTLELLSPKYIHQS